MSLLVKNVNKSFGTKKVVDKIAASYILESFLNEK